MTNKKPGLPESFSIEVDSPVDLGDYLDEERFGAENAPLKTTSDSEELEEEQSLGTRSIKSFKISKAALKQANILHDKEGKLESERLATNTKARTATRKQINMKPETLRKAEELLWIIRERGPQRDAAASELFDAIMAALYEARDQIDLSTVSKRGRWGSPTAAAFVTSLRSAFTEAISKRNSL